MANLIFDKAQIEATIDKIVDRTMRMDMTWDWPCGVAYYGICEAYEVTKNERYLQLVKDRVDEYIELGLPSWTVNTCSMGHCLITLYEHTGDEKYLDIAKSKVEYLEKEALRFGNHVLQHTVSVNNDFPEQAWADTLFMAGFFLLRMGVLLKDEALIDDALNQYYWHIKYLQDPESGLYYHGYNNITGDHMSGIKWGRANAWAAYTMAQVGVRLPQCYLYPKFLDVVGSLNDQLAALKLCQTENGLWRTIVDDAASYEEDDTVTLAAAPEKGGYTFTGWSGTGLDGENNMTVTIPTGSTGNRTYTAHWRYNGSGSGGSSSYPITVPSKTENGTVTVSPKNASAGSTVTITVKPDSGYVLETISVTDKNDNDLKLTDKGNGKYTFTMPTSKVEIKVTFMEDNSVLNFFYDVPNDAYYYEAVKWAAENGITGGVGNSLFAPNQPCTRAQIMTFLWRAAGSPVVNYQMPFTDVDEGAYYAEAVRWAASTGIVTGLTETTFGTDSVCTRAQAAAMIYRCAQAQGKGFTGAWMFHLPFTDVPEWAYESVAWCYMNGVTTGVSETAFAPGNDCTRAQIVTFLWRAFSK